MYRQLSDKTMTFKKGEIILQQGEAAKNLYFLESGSCYRALMTDKGVNITYEIKEADGTVNSLLGVLTVYGCCTESNFTFTARTTCKCLRIPVEDFKAWVVDQPDVLLELLNMSVSKLTDARIAFQSYQEGRIANRFCQILLSCSRIEGNDHIITKRYTFNEMASMLGVHQVTVSRMVRSLCEEGVLEKVSSGLLITDYEQLRKYAFCEEQLSYK